jgi:hypothetical protein
VANALFLKPLPYSGPSRLTVLWLRSPGIGIPQDWPSPGQYIDILTQYHTRDRPSPARNRLSPATAPHPPATTSHPPATASHPPTTAPRRAGTSSPSRGCKERSLRPT